MGTGKGFRVGYFTLPRKSGIGGGGGNASSTAERGVLLEPAEIYARDRNESNKSRRHPNGPLVDVLMIRTTVPSHPQAALNLQVVS